MLEVKGLSFKHKGEEKEIIKEISFIAKKGELTSILGPNGAGKSTLFKCLAGIWTPYKGDIKVDTVKINGLSFKERAKIFSFVPQNHSPSFSYSVFDVVLMGRASYQGLFSQPEKKDYEIAEMALYELGIYHLKDVPYTKISGGERQLVLIARAIAQKSSVMLLDEPVSHLDFKNQILVLKKIKEIARKRSIIVLITLHDPNLASFFSDKILFLKDGSLIKEGSPSEVITEHSLKELYKINTSILSLNGIRIIFPSHE